MSQSKVISVKRWGTRLNSKPSAQALRRKCERMLIKDEQLIINMAGVKDITPGFAQECFGKLYIVAKYKGARIKFQYTEEILAPIVVNGIKAELDY